MHRCLVQTHELFAEAFALSRDEARHLQTVLRAKPGDRVTLFDGQGHTRLAVIASVEKHGLSLAAEAPAVKHPRPPCRITLFACVSKGKRMDWTVEKAVELGVGRIVPVISDRTIVRLDANDGDAKVDRWLRVAEEAARQCGSVWLPEITPPASFRASMTLMAGTAPVFVAALTPGAQPLRAALAAFHATAPHQAGWFVGPEGDFTPAELEELLAAGTIPVSLGQQVLRAETACLYGLCALNCAWL
ncbi:MAG TPA: RsmE family RNA methyltransferase [Kiritimatiellia bacterium]|nr:RsmE family RNA methyltransferase [Kiritimatiellia bacterium]HPS09577.1 RsmE family RNA methyltransferase [Kiritimatiellia bacterium]